MTSSWMVERDRLLAQANSLVKHVSSARAAPSPAVEKPHDRPLTPQPRPASSAPPPSYAPSQPYTPSQRPRAPNEGEADHQPLTTARRHPRTDAQAGETIPIPMVADTERDDIEIRVARFRERQTKLAMERQSHSEAVRRDTTSKLLRDKNER